MVADVRPRPMTPAEFTILLAACGLNDQQAAALFGVRDRTLRYWRAGHVVVPAKIAAAIAHLDHDLDELVRRTVEALPDIAAEGGGEPEQIRLVAYRNDDDFASYQVEEAKRLRFASAHRALIGRARRALEEAGYKVRILWLEPDSYEAWRREEKLPDRPDTRAAWAAQQEIDD